MGVFFLKKLKNLTIGILIGLIAGLWFGSNLSKDKSLFSNPFANNTIQSQIKKTSNKVMMQSGKALEKSGKALRNAALNNK